MHAASLIRALSSCPSGMYPERAERQKDALLLHISNINLFCPTVHPVDYSTLQSLALQETSLKPRAGLALCGASALLACSPALLWSSAEDTYNACSHKKCEFGGRPGN